MRARDGSARTGDYDQHQLRRLRVLRKGWRVNDDKRWLTLADVVARLREAGYDDSRDTVRRAIDAGQYGVEGADWYRTESGYRKVMPAAVDRLIARRKRQPEVT
jgi:hypothetical protein